MFQAWRNILKKKKPNTLSNVVELYKICRRWLDAGNSPFITACDIYDSNPVAFHSLRVKLNVPLMIREAECWEVGEALEQAGVFMFAKFVTEVHHGK